MNEALRELGGRGARPDAIVGDTWYLIKNVSKLRLTYQVRLLTFLASDAGACLRIRLPESALISPDLRRFLRDHRETVSVERV
jgi:hypothetical protein